MTKLTPEMIALLEERDRKVSEPYKRLSTLEILQKAVDGAKRIIKARETDSNSTSANE